MNNGVFAIQQPVQTFRLRRKIFKDAGTYTWNRPAGVTSCRVEIKGGRGADNSCPANYTSGGFGAVIATNLPSQVMVVVGSNAVTGPTAGGSSSFGGYATSTGGSANGTTPGTFTAASPYETEEGIFTAAGNGTNVSSVIIEWVEPVS